MFTAIFVALFVSAWVLCGTGVWLAASVATRGGAGLGMLPVAMAAGVVGGLAVPLLVRDDLAGLWMSFALAAALPGMLLVTRAFAGSALRPSAGSAEPTPGVEP